MTNETLRALGLSTIGDLLRLPRDAFARRFGTGRLDDLDRALGVRSDPQPLYEPPAHFSARIELPADVSETAQLMFPARRLLASLEGFLRGRNAGATELVFSATHSARRGMALPPTMITLALAAPERDAQRLAALLGERLARVQLPAPALTLALTVEQLHAFSALNASLLPPSAHDGDVGVDWLQLAETLHARLGSERVFQLQAVDDHRPERAWRALPHRRRRRAAHHAAGDPSAPRPLLLLPTPQPLPVHGEQPLYRARAADAGHRPRAHRVRLVGCSPAPPPAHPRVPCTATTSSPATRAASGCGSTANSPPRAAGSCTGCLRESAMTPSYAELHCLSNFSFLRGASHPEELVERALALEYTGLALTDECSFAGSVRAHLALAEAREHGRTGARVPADPRHRDPAPEGR